MYSSSNKWIKKVWLAVGASMVLLASTVLADPGPVIFMCNACHGPNGVSANKDVATLAGISPYILEFYMEEYRESSRPCKATGKGKMVADMCGISKGVTPEKAAEIAEYYAAVKFVPAKQTFDAEKAAVGMRVHNERCGICHTDGGTNADDDSSILGGQWMPYLEEAIKVFRSGERPVLEEHMLDKINTLDDAEAEALVHYYGSLQ